MKKPGTWPVWVSLLAPSNTSAEIWGTRIDDRDFQLLLRKFYDAWNIQLEEMVFGYSYAVKWGGLQIELATGVTSREAATAIATAFMPTLEARLVEEML